MGLEEWFTLWSLMVLLASYSRSASFGGTAGKQANLQAPDAVGPESGSEA